jgi:hypothetical protein
MSTLLAARQSVSKITCKNPERLCTKEMDQSPLPSGERLFGRSGDHFTGGLPAVPRLGAPPAVAYVLGMDVGIAGVILAVPILATLKIFCAHIKPMEPLAEFLS